MRVLDVGCHDGFVGAWVKRHLEAAGVDVELVGIEPHAGFAQAARDRGYVEVLEGTAEERCGDLPADSFDAVVCYEVWEHAMDPDRLLAAAERVLAPGGLVYVSTPEGAFGDGSNPHHLRAVRGVDFFDRIAARGAIESFHPGADGVNAVAYRPQSRRGTAAIVCPAGWERWHPADIDTRGLGGSETAAARLADHLSRQGWHVTLYGDLEVGGWRSVTMRHADTFDPMEPRDLLIVQRSAIPFTVEHRARRAMLWVHDTDFGPLTGRAAANLDDVLCLSRWHERHLRFLYPPIADKLRRIRNGIEPAVAAAARDAAGERQPRVVYSSSPDRGLDALLDVWPAVRRRVPDAELACCYADVYNRVADLDPRVAAHRDRLRQRIADLEDQGVTQLGSLPQPGLALLMAESRAWAHPSMTPEGPFHETSCIGAMEAQAAGCAVVASGWGALPETVRVGMLVEDGDGWLDGFAAEIVRALTDPDVLEWAQAEGPTYAAALGWEQVAAAVGNLADGGVHVPPDPPDRHLAPVAG